MIGERGYEATTMRDIAGAAGVSVGLLYKYFPSKRAVVLTLYDRLSAEYAARAADCSRESGENVLSFAMRTCLEVLGPYRSTLCALRPVLLGDRDESLICERPRFPAGESKESLLMLSQRPRIAPDRSWRSRWVGCFTCYILRSSCGGCSIRVRSSVRPNALWWRCSNAFCRCSALL